MKPRTEAGWWRLIGEAHELAAYGKQHPQVSVFDDVYDNSTARGLCIIVDNSDDAAWITGPTPTEDMRQKMDARLKMLDPDKDVLYHYENGVRWPFPWWWERCDRDGWLERANACYLLAAMAESEDR